MKKILTSAIIISSLLLSFFTTYYYGKLNFYNMISHQEYLSTHIKDNNQLKDPEQFINIIQTVANQYDINVERQTYTLDDSLKKTIVTKYVYVNHTNLSFDKIQLLNGRYLTKEDTNSDVYLSSKSSNNINQIGQIKSFDQANQLDILPFPKLITQNLSGDYTITTSDKTIAEQFVQSLNELGLEAKVNAFTYVSSPYINLTILLIVGILYFIIFFLILIFFVYFIILRFKEFSIKKMLGFTNQHLIKNILLKDLVLNQLISIGISLTVTTIYLAFYNNFSGFISFLPIWLIVELGLNLLLLLFCYPITYLVKCISSGLMLKNKQPKKLIQCINASSKFIFSVCAIVVLSILINNFVVLSNQNQNIHQWEQVKDYASFWYSPDELPTVGGKLDSLAEYPTQVKMQKFYQLTNQQGGFIISPSQEYTYKNTTPPNWPSYHPYKNRITINNNYLKLNPIFDTASRQVDVPDENTTDLTILVPEKYKNNADDILQLYTQFHTENYYFTRQIVQTQSGVDLGYDPGAYGEIIKHVDPLKVHIIFVKNDQQYFTYNPTYCTESNNIITDPIAIIANNQNMGVDDYTTIISNGEYFCKVSDTQNPVGSFKATMISAGVENNIIRVNMLYDQVGNYIYETKTQIALECMLIIIVAIIIILIIIYSILNYMEANKKINAVKKIHGFSFFKRHFAFLKYVPIFWGVIWISMLGIVKLMDLSETINLSILGIGSLSFMTIDLLVCYLTIRLKEIQKAKDILKGE